MSWLVNFQLYVKLQTQQLSEAIMAELRELHMEKQNLLSISMNYPILMPMGKIKLSSTFPQTLGNHQSLYRKLHQVENYHE